MIVSTTTTTKTTLTSLVTELLPRVNQSSIVVCSYFSPSRASSTPVTKLKRANTLRRWKVRFFLFIQFETNERVESYCSSQFFLRCCERGLEREYKYPGNWRIPLWFKCEQTLRFGGKCAFQLISLKETKRIRTHRPSSHLTAKLFFRNVCLPSLSHNFLSSCLWRRYSRYHRRRNTCGKDSIGL